MLHVLKQHDERLSIRADTVELNNVLMLQHRQQLRLALEI